MDAFLRGILFSSLFLVMGCNGEIEGELVNRSNSTLQLYEGGDGKLVELTEGKLKVEIDNDKSLVDRILALGEPIRVTLTQGIHKFFVDIDPSKVDPNGNFAIDEVELGQPVRIQGRFLAGQATNSSQSVLEINIFKGFSKAKIRFGNSKRSQWNHRSFNRLSL